MNTGKAFSIGLLKQHMLKHDHKIVRARIDKELANGKIEKKVTDNYKCTLQDTYVDALVK